MDNRTKGTRCGQRKGEGVSRKIRDPDEPMWVVGCIDAYGSVRARVVPGDGDVMHRPDESKGKRWRFNIWANEFHATRNPTLDHLTDEEYQIVSDWLIKHGHKEKEKP
jgi:hypothetical protein